MGDAQRGDDALHFFAAALGPTRRLDVVSGGAVQFPDTDGALVPSRYLLFIDDLSQPGSQTVWVRTGKFEKGKTLAVSADIPHFPMKRTGVVSVEINVRKGDNDQIAAIMSSGTGSLYITQISRVA